MANDEPAIAAIQRVHLYGSPLSEGLRDTGFPEPQRR
jgi:hypothetical protein